MYVAKLGRSWLSSPFWKSSFLLESVVDLNAIHASGIREVWIDTARGIGLEMAPPAVAEPAPEAEPQPEPEPAPAPPEPPRTASMAGELDRAARVMASSRTAVSAMFAEARLGNAISIGKASEVVEQVADSVMRNSGALIGLLRLKTADDYTYMHSVAVCALMIALARQLGQSDADVRMAGMAGLMHDIGKLAVAPEILNKPGKLSDAEFSHVRGHPGAGHALLKQADGVGAMILDVCLHHHEKLDGTGYPYGLRGDQISLAARMGAVCDIYDAITSNRPYKAGWGPAESLRRMAEWRGSHLDPAVFSAFVQCVGIYPVGSLVRLASGRLAIVTELAQGKALTTPIVKVFFSLKSNTFIPPALLDLSLGGNRDEIVGIEDAASYQFKDLDRLWCET